MLFVTIVSPLDSHSTVYEMLSREGLEFFHRILFLVTKLRLHPFTVRNFLLVDAESKRTHLIGWTTVVLNILYIPLVMARIKEAGKVEGVIHSLLLVFFVGCISSKLTILKYHSELIEVVRNVVLFGPKIGKNNFNCLKNVLFGFPLKKI